MLRLYNFEFGSDAEGCSAHSFDYLALKPQLPSLDPRPSP